MIGWIYSDPVRIGFRSGVTRDDQFFLEATKTFVDTSNRSRVVTDIMYDDFMQLERPLSVQRVPSRLAATRRASPSSQVREHGHPAARLEPSHQVAKSYGKIPKSQNCVVNRPLNDPANILGHSADTVRAGTTPDTT